MDILVSQWNSCSTDFGASDFSRKNGTMQESFSTLEEAAKAFGELVRTDCMMKATLITEKYTMTMTRNLGGNHYFCDYEV